METEPGGNVLSVLPTAVCCVLSNDVALVPLLVVLLLVYCCRTLSR
jgi:hypothetical protein